MAMYDQRMLDEQRRKDMASLIDNLEMYIKQEDFTHPGFYALLRQLLVPFNLLISVTKTAEKLQLPNIHPDYAAMINRKIKERLYPLLVAYHRGLASEGDAVWNQQERDKRDKVVKSKSWKEKVGFGGKNESDTDNK
jgi:hypothetical protein